jgi:protein TonB
VRPVSEELRRIDPLRRPGSDRARRVAAAAGFGLAAAALQGSLLLGATLLGRVFPNSPEAPADRAAERVVVRVVEPSPAPAAPEPVPAPPEEPAAPAPEPTPVEAPRPKPAPRQPEPGPPADPVDADSPEPEASPGPRRRVVGISLESTVSAGDGPAFAVGNTRMGRTGEQAEDPAGAGRLGPGARGTPGAGSGGAPAGPNRASTLVPAAGSELVKPVRLAAVEPLYPALLEAAGKEGSVGMMIRISAAGAVQEVRVVRSSGYPEFDEAAREAALRERFSPARRDGQPIDYTLKYNYRFRIKGA